MQLGAGRFYVSRDRNVWCCYRLDLKKEEHCQAFCIRVSDARTEYFYLDGRYDAEGKREHSLVKRLFVNEEVTTPAVDPKP
jgi:hypothetical protein